MLVIFDCDGVLVDSELLACQVDADLLTSMGLPYTRQQIVDQFVGTSLKHMIATIEQDRGVVLPEDFGHTFNQAVFARFETDLQAIPGIHEAILALPFRRCVASSSTPDRIALSLRVTGLSDLFEHVFSAVEVARGKPAPDLFLHAAARMAYHPADCIVIEDSVAGVTAARAAGMRVLGFTGGSHCGPDHAGRLKMAGADAIMGTMADLPFLVRQTVLME